MTTLAVLCAKSGKYNQIQHVKAVVICRMYSANTQEHQGYQIIANVANTTKTLSQCCNQMNIFIYKTVVRKVKQTHSWYKSTQRRCLLNRLAS